MTSVGSVPSDFETGYGEPLHEPVYPVSKMAKVNWPGAYSEAQWAKESWM